MNVSLPHSEMLNVLFPHFLLSAFLLTLRYWSITLPYRAIRQGYLTRCLSPCEVKKILKIIAKLFGGFKYFLYLCTIIIKAGRATRCRWST